jgi:myo-inositol-1(or 4)-monophosphatase
MTDFWTAILDFASTTTARVGSQLLQDFGQVQASQKADGSLVTQADKWADREIQDAIASNFEGYGILSEEGDHTFPDAEWCWVIDPLDGTTNFTRGIPIWSISLGLLYRGTPVFGYVYLPTLSHSFHGFWAGDSGLATPTGAFLNHHPIYTSTDSPSSNHFFNLCSRSTSVIQPGFPCKIRMLGVASYNFLSVASGATLGGVERSPKVWDLAGAWVILQAAGGSWISLNSEPVFPLMPGEEYGDRSYPTLVVSRAELVPVFQPFLKSL